MHQNDYTSLRSIFYKIIPLLLSSLSFTQYTLENCTTDIADNVPYFYHKYFECVTANMSESGDYVNIYYNGVPPYETWYFEDSHPNNIPYASQGQGYYEVPGEIIEQDYVVSIPVAPQVRPNVRIQAPDVNGEVDGSYQEYPMGSVGVALNGVNMFNPCASPPDVIEDEFFGFDYYFGHPAGASGIYHYHTKSQGPLEVLNHNLPDVVTNTTPGSAEIELYGLMCDGTFVLGCTELDGSMPESSDWDAQNGHIHDMVDEDGITHFELRYHTHVCFLEMTEEDVDGNGFEDHEFTPEIAYYVSPSDMTYNILQGSNNNGLCGAMTNPYEPDMQCADGSELDCNGLCQSDGASYGAARDCLGVCGGSAIEDECGVCNGSGIAQGECDCSGNVDDCNGVCGGNALVDGNGQCSLGNTRGGIIPDKIALLSSYPNPFNPSTLIRFTVNNLLYISIDIYNMSGQKIKNLESGYKEPGTYSTSWNGHNSPSGIYLVRLSTKDIVQSQMITLVK